MPLEIIWSKYEISLFSKLYILHVIASSIILKTWIILFLAPPYLFRVLRLHKFLYKFNMDSDGSLKKEYVEKLS